VAAYLAVPANPETLAAVIGSSTQQKVAAAAIISFGIELRMRWSVCSFALVLTALFVGFRNVADLGPGNLLGQFSVTYLVVLWALAVGARHAVLQAAEGVDASLAALGQARLSAAVTRARRRHEREQLALMHDTAASTLLVVANRVDVGPARLAAQATRDLAVLEAGVPVFDDRDVDLPSLLADVVSACRTPTSIRGQRSLPVRPAVAWAVTAAVREALNNVDRHAHAESVQIEVNEHRVVIVDDGVGFAGQSGRRTDARGIRRSIVERMNAIGGAAEVSTLVGAGTSVKLTWTPSSGAADTVRDTNSPDPVGGVQRLEHRLAFALTGVSLVDITLQSSRAWSQSAVTPPAWVHAALAVTAAACALSAPTSVRRSRGATLALMTTAVAVSVALGLLLPAPEVLGTTNWTVGAVGWTIVALGLRESRAMTLTALGGWWLLVCGIVLARVPSAAMAILLGYLTVTILSTQVLIVWFAHGIHDVVTEVTRRDRERRSIETATAVERVLRNDGRRRYRARLKSLLPLLRGLADGTLHPASPRTVSAARVEYGRLRRLFDRADHIDRWLTDDLSAAIDDAEERGVHVTAEIVGDLPGIPDGARAELSAVVSALLAASTAHARIVTMAEDGDVVVSIVCDAPAVAVPRATGRDGGVRSEVSVDETSEALWLRLRCRGLGSEGDEDDQDRRD
jgi:hypothetical protein